MCKQNNKWKYQGDTRYEKVYEKMQLLGIKNIIKMVSLIMN